MKKILPFSACILITVNFLLPVSSFSCVPSFVWAKQMGGSTTGGMFNPLAITGNSIAVDNNGNVYTTGAFRGTVDFDPGAGVYNLTSAGDDDFFVSKLDASGNFVWARRMGGAGRDPGYAIAVDGSGNVYTTGFFQGTVDFDPSAGIFNLTSAGGSTDIFVSKLNTSGNFVWAKAMGGSSGATSEIGTGIAVDGSGNVYTTGYFGSTTDFDPGAGIYNLTPVAYFDCFVSKLDASGNFVWAKNIVAGADDDYSYGITVDGSGNVYTTGWFELTADFDPGAGTYNLTAAGSWDIFVSKLNTAGNFVWARRMGGTAFDIGNSIAVDGSGNVYTTGWFGDIVDFDPGAGTYNLTSAGGPDIFVSKLNTSGNFVWARQMGGADVDQGHGITLDGSGNVYTTGRFTGTADFDPGAGTFNLTPSGGGTTFLSRLNSAGNFACAGGMGGDVGNDIAAGLGSDTVYITGSFTGTADFDPTSGTYNLINGSDGDMFVSKYGKCISILSVTAASTNINCNGVCSGTATVTPTGTSPYTYSWSSGQSTSAITGLCVGTYSVSVSDATSATVTATVVITEPSTALSATATATSAACGGTGTAAVNASGGTSGYTYVWNNSQTTQTATGLTPGNYTITVTDANGCSATQTVTVVSSGSVTATAGPNSTLCPGENTTITASGGGTYSWSNGQTTASIVIAPTTNTSYSVIVVNGSCSDTATATVILAPGPTAAVSPGSTICAGETATLTASGGTNYVWSTGASSSSINITPSSTTNYSVTVTNASGCSDTASATVMVDPSITTNVTPAAICAGDSALLTATGGGTYLWNTTETTSSIYVSPTSTSNYTVIVTNGVCSDSATATVNVTSTITATIIGNTSICAGNNTTLTVIGGSSFLWSTGASTTSIVVTPTASSSYSVVVTSSSCSNSDSATVTVNPLPTATISSATTICAGQSTTLNASGGTSYQWTPSTGLNCNTCASPTANPSSTTNYLVTVTNSNGCSDTASATVMVEPNIITTVTPAAICAGDSALLTSTGGGTYLWNTGASTSSIYVSPTVTTSYTVFVTSGVCSASAEATVTVTGAITAAISGIDTICIGDNVLLSGNGGGSYLWSTGVSFSSIAVNPLVTTTYTLIVSAGSCTAAATFTVHVEPNPTANAGSNVSITTGNMTTLSASGGAIYSWSSGAITSTITVSPSATTMYCVTVTNASNCTDTACVTVYVDMLCGDIFVPTAFSPNEDFHNDAACVRGACIESLRFMIYDRWGKRVFETSNPKICWDGIYKGKLMHTQVFVYYLEATLTSGEQITKKGNISLMR